MAERELFKSWDQYRLSRPAIVKLAMRDRPWAAQWAGDTPWYRGGYGTAYETFLTFEEAVAELRRRGW